jgi:hypothetical protein
MKKNKFSVWGAIGRTAVIISMIWASVQLFNYLFKKEYKLTVVGNTADFLLPNDIEKKLSRLKEDELFIKACGLKNIPLNENTLSKRDIKIDLYQLQNDRLMADYQINEDFYKYIWWYTISNNGTRPVEEIQLEIPFSGYFKISYPDSVRYGEFKNKVKVHTLNPGHEIKITLWDSDMYETNIDDYKEKSRVTHKNGISKIKYPVIQWGFWAWNKRNYGTPMMILILILGTLIILTFALGVKYGPIIKKWDKEQKLKELKDLQRLKEEADTEHLDKSK